ncbi:MULTISPECIES: 50S ribosomal protein L11 methyltransferase [unclassified Nocardiopsis]|uniref:50S ribosomal protein L11 methyltransferase n=1 Tax=unclassified Nocardiopsis TaxID=2649073 RepID=UPI001359D820|nr:MULTISPECIES: 50S ribosomal protein L11 methyltransferase [unclassified Nocardiopsis]
MDGRTLLMHQVMLSDGERLRAYDLALRESINPGDVVADLGAGMLALSFLALRHGAGHVFAVEGDPDTAAMAARIAESNGLADRLTVVRGDARKVRLPVPADVVVGELMGNLGPEEEMPETFAEFAADNLAEGGRVVPGRLTTDLTAIQFDGEGWGVWSEDFLGYDLRAVQEHAAPGPQLHFFQRDPLPLSRSVPAVTADLGAKAPSASGEVHELPITRPGTLHAVMGSFTAAFTPGVSLSNFPSYPGCNWAVWIWPLRHTAVAPGDVLGVRLHRPESVRDVAEWRLDCGIVRRKERT